MAAIISVDLWPVIVLIASFIAIAVARGPLLILLLNVKLHICV